MTRATTARSTRLKTFGALNNVEGQIVQQLAGHHSTCTLTPAVSGIGLTFTASTRKLGGTPSTPKAEVTYTYKAEESSDTDGDTESATKTFTIGIQPKATTLSGTAGNGVPDQKRWLNVTSYGQAGVTGAETVRHWTPLTGYSYQTAYHIAGSRFVQTDANGAAVTNTFTTLALPDWPAAPDVFAVKAGDAKILLCWEPVVAAPPVRCRLGRR